VIGLRMRIKWRCDVGCIVDKNWIPGGTGEAMGLDNCMDWKHVHLF